MRQAIYRPFEENTENVISLLNIPRISTRSSVASPPLTSIPIIGDSEEAELPNDIEEAEDDNPESPPKQRGIISYRNNNIQLGKKEQELVSLFEEHGVDAIITSGIRPNSKTKQGRTSRHSSYDEGAFDIVPQSGSTFEKMYQQILSSPEIIE